jgi:ABC-type multidrug transport system fused ATPase/permease subunit
MGESSIENAGKAAVPPAEVDDEKKSITTGDQADSGSPVKEDKAANKARPEREATAADYFRVFTYAKKWDFVLMAAAALASIGAGTTLPLMNVVFGRLVGDFNSYFTPSAQEAAEFSAQINRMSLYMFALFIARFGLNYINKFCFRLIGIRMSAAIRLHYLRSLFGQTIHVLDSMPSGAAASTITGTANTLQLGISEKLGTFLEFTSTIVSAIIIAFTYSWSLTLVTASVILFISLVLSILLPFIIKGQTRLTRADAKGTSVATEAFGTIRMITACGAQDRMSQRYAEWVTKAKDAVQFGAPFMSVQFGAVFFGLYGAFALAFWFGMKSYIEGRLEGISTILIVLMSVMLMVISLERISTPLIAVSKAMVAAAEFFAVIDAPKPNMGTLKAPDVSAEQDIVFEDVHFAYPSRPSKKVLDGLNLRIGANLNTAIVGPSGSGKSTIVGLIEGWYTLHDQYVIAKAVEKDKKKEEKEKKKKKKKKKKGKTNDEDEDDDEDALAPLDAEDLGPPVELKGSISTCGKQLGDIDIKWWRSQIGLVQQEPFLFNNTIFHNVATGLIGTQWENESEEVKRQLVKEACAESFADEFIDRLPDGYDTQVGDSGAKLSGGQRQRIAIARSIIKKPKILILDEATSAIDVRGERIVQAALERASKGRTTITIAHRLSTIKNADRICVLQNGVVAEEGTHDSLLENELGVYYGLVNAQKLSLGDETGEELLHDEDIGAVLAREKSAAKSVAGSTKQEAKWKDRNLLNGFGKLIMEQRSRFPLYIIAVIGAMGAAAAVPIQAYLFAQVIVVFQEEDPIVLMERATFWSKMWTALAAGVGASYFLTAFVSTNLEGYISATYRKEYFESIIAQPTSYFDKDDNATGQLTARLSSDPQALKELLGINLMMLLVGIFSLAGALAISFAYGWKLALVALCVTVPLGILAGFFRVRYELQFNAMNEEVFQESSKFGAEAIGAFRTVSALVMEDSICDRYQGLLTGHVWAAYKKARFTTIVFAFADSCSLGCQALIFWYGGQLLLSREYDVGAFIVTYMAVIQGAESAGQWLSFGPNAAQAAAAANRILQARESRINNDASQSKDQITDTDGGVKIELKDVHFKYPTRDVSIFKGLNITIEKGQFAALVGASGSGKTSIVSLLERFYDVSKGQILFNGKDITDVNVYEYRKLLSLVAQESSLFHGTIRENLLLGVDPSTITDEQLHQCCRDASIHDFIISLPDGYNTNIGSRGVSLSGGQKQRISIARALIRNPRVLLLDEATSSLDSGEYPIPLNNPSVVLSTNTPQQRVKSLSKPRSSGSPRAGRRLRSRTASPRSRKPTSFTCSARARCSRRAHTTSCSSRKACIGIWYVLMLMVRC